MQPYAKAAFSAIEPVAPKAAALLHRQDCRFDISATFHLVGARELDWHHMTVVRDARAVSPLLQVSSRELKVAHAVRSPCSFQIGDASDFPFGRDILFAHLEHQDLPLVIAKGVIEPGEHFTAPRRIERAAKDTVLNMIEAIVFAHSSYF
jgi:hypothetical protein